MIVCVAHFYRVCVICLQLAAMHTQSSVQAAYIISENCSDPVSVKPDLLFCCPLHHHHHHHHHYQRCASSPLVPVEVGVWRWNEHIQRDTSHIRRCTVGDTDSEWCISQRTRILLLTQVVNLSWCIAYRDSKRQQWPRDVNSALFTTQTQKKPLVVKQDVQDKRTVVFCKKCRSS